MSFYEERYDISASMMRKIPKGRSANDMKGEGIWRYESMSDSENDYYLVCILSRYLLHNMMSR